MFNEYSQLQQKLVPLAANQRYKITPNNFLPEWGEWINAEAAMLVLTAMALMNSNVVCRDDLIALLRKDQMARWNLVNAVNQIDIALEGLCGNGLIALNVTTGDIIPRPELLDLVAGSEVIVEKLTSPIQVAQIDDPDVFTTIEL